MHDDQLARLTEPGEPGRDRGRRPVASDVVEVAGPTRLPARGDGRVADGEPFRVFLVHVGGTVGRRRELPVGGGADLSVRGVDVEVVAGEPLPDARRRFDEVALL